MKSLLTKILPILLIPSICNSINAQSGENSIDPDSLEILTIDKEDPLELLNLLQNKELDDPQSSWLISSFRSSNCDDCICVEIGAQFIMSGIFEKTINSAKWFYGTKAPHNLSYEDNIRLKMTMSSMNRIINFMDIDLAKYITEENICRCTDYIPEEIIKTKGNISELAKETYGQLHSFLKKIPKSEIR